MRFGRRHLVRAGLGLGFVALLVWLVPRLRFPSDRTPEGAYLRVAKAVVRGKPQEFFAYLETEAQHAAYTVVDYRKRARALVLSAYPEPERTRLAKEYEAEALLPDGADLVALHAERHGMAALLRRDLSGVAKVEVEGVRATVETVRGTRYAFRRRDNGIWGMTLFTAHLRAAAERAARDFAVVEQAARDHERARAAAAPAGSGSTL
jgi:hypothetical protein